MAEGERWFQRECKHMSETTRQAGREVMGTARGSRTGAIRRARRPLVFFFFCPWVTYLAVKNQICHVDDQATFNRFELSPHLVAEQVWIAFFSPPAAFIGGGLHGNLLQIFSLSESAHGRGVTLASLTR